MECNWFKFDDIGDYSCIFCLQVGLASVIFEEEFNMYRLQNITRARRGVFVLPKYIKNLTKYLKG